MKLMRILSLSRVNCAALIFATLVSIILAPNSRHTPNILDT